MLSVHARDRCWSAPWHTAFELQAPCPRDDATRWLTVTSECETGYAHPLAPQRLPAPLVLEAETGGETAFTPEPSPADPGDGRREDDFPGPNLAVHIRVGLSRRFSELAVFDARLYIRVRRIDEPA